MYFSFQTVTLSLTLTFCFHFVVLEVAVHCSGYAKK